MTDSGKLPNLTFYMKYIFNYIVHNTVDVRQHGVNDGVDNAYKFWEETIKFEITVGQVPPPKRLFIKTIHLSPINCVLEVFQFTYPINRT